MTLPLFQVDAFTAEPFAGNPAAVCLLDAGERLPGGARGPDPAWMQQVAAEMNLSETAFLLPGRDQHAFRLRWFTPTVEVDLCGHATLASAHVLWTEDRVRPGQPIRFDTRSGALTARPVAALAWRSARPDAIELDFPATPATPLDPPEGLLEALGAVEARWVGASRSASRAPAGFDYLVELESEAAVRGLEPDFRRLRELEAHGVIVTARSAQARYDFVSRYFAPGAGIDEDPVTGSAHCTLAPFWAQRLGLAELTGFQASRRGGVVGVRPQGDRVLLTGQAVTVVRGQLG